MIDQTSGINIINHYIDLTRKVISMSEQSYSDKPRRTNWKWICENHINEVLSIISQGYEYSYDCERGQKNIELKHKSSGVFSNISCTLYDDADDVEFYFRIKKSEF